MEANDIEEAAREQLVDETIRGFVEIVLTEKFADMPNWMDLDLTVSQVRAIYLLAFHGTLTISKMASLLGMGKPAASILVQQLVQQELVERAEDPVDRRRALVHLTGRGVELVRGRIDRRESKFRSRLRQMSDEELTNLLHGILALGKIIRSEQEQLNPPETDEASCI
jgi:DNA-binding MarR family transcriptional regulator